MPTEDPNSILILSKSRDLVSHLIRQLERIDQDTFPSKATAIAAEVLGKILLRIQATIDSNKSDIQVLFVKLAKVERIVSEIEESARSTIPLPLVAYCDGSWESLFPGISEAERPRVFYTVSTELNYSLEDFKAELGHIMETILDMSEIEEQFPKHKIWHLRLPRLEGGNIPLFANASHEYGHALFDENSARVESWIDKAFHGFFGGLEQDLEKELEGASIKKLVREILVEICGELFDDTVATFLVGPAFLVALSEMEAVGDANAWHISVQNPSDTHTSFGFRALVIAEGSHLDRFEGELRTKLRHFMAAEADPICNILTTMPQHETERSEFVVGPSKHMRRDAVSKIFAKHKVEIQSACRDFAGRCYREIPKGLIPKVSEDYDGGEVADLIRRIRLGVPPNTIPTEHYLGKPAPLGAILTASALYRQSVLRGVLRGTGEEDEDIPDALARVDRLSLKALEVSFVQTRFYKKFPRRGAHADTKQK